MARKRILDPDFFRNEDLAECSPLARLLFAGMWCWADREGRLEDRPRRIKAEILPYDNADGVALVEELSEHGFIERYEASGVKVIQIVNFRSYQDPHPRETPSELPGPTEGEPKADLGQTKVPPRSPSPSCPSRPSQPSRPARQSEGGVRAVARLGDEGQELVSRVCAGLGRSLRPLVEQAQADEFERLVIRHGGVESCLGYIAATCRKRDVDPEGVALLLIWLREWAGVNRDTG